MSMKVNDIPPQARQQVQTLLILKENTQKSAESLTRFHKVFNGYLPDRKVSSLLLLALFKLIALCRCVGEPAPDAECNGWCRGRPSQGTQISFDLRNIILGKDFGKDRALICLQKIKFLGYWRVGSWLYV